MSSKSASSPPHPQKSAHAKTSLQRKNRFVLVLTLCLLVTMILLAFASVPLYRIFCQKTGYGGTPQLVYENNTMVSDRLIKVRFNAMVQKDLPWRFKPLQKEITVYAGETGLAFYQVENTSKEPLIGIATYNVTPDKAGLYFNKVACFCFEEQTLPPGQVIDMPVQFFIDPKIDEDPNLKEVETITLSYTFFHAKDPNIPEILGLPSLRKPH